MSLQEIRNLIDIEKKEWVNIFDTNCYAYALGLDVPNYQIRDFAYIPGTIAGSRVDLVFNSVFAYNDLIRNMFLDFQALGIDYKEVNCFDPVFDDEWKIALFISKVYGGLDDFHFLRQRRDELWYHKSGVFGVSSYDDGGLLITDPRKCFLDGYTYNKCFCLKLKK